MKKVTTALLGAMLLLPPPRGLRPRSEPAAPEQRIRGKLG